MDSQPVIACSLSEPDLQSRLAYLRGHVLSLIKSETNVNNGIRLDFENSRDVTSSVLEMVQLEHECCPFLEMQVAVPPAPADITLTFSGTDDVLVFVRSLFLTPESAQ